MKISKRIALLLILFFISITAVWGQSTFPSDSTQGTTEQNENIRPVQIPNVAIQIISNGGKYTVTFGNTNRNAPNGWKDRMHDWTNAKSLME